MKSEVVSSGAEQGKEAARVDLVAARALVSPHVAGRWVD